MSREILFRGKRVDNGEWVYGHYLEDKRFNSHIIFGFVSDEMNHSGLEIMQYEVYPKTVGQYTGFKDDKGIKIFEGDIIQYLDSHPMSTENGYDWEYIDNIGQIKWDSELACFGITDREDVSLDVFWSATEDECSIIGNVHDTPKFLGEKSKKQMNKISDDIVKIIKNKYHINTEEVSILNNSKYTLDIYIKLKDEKEITMNNWKTVFINWMKSEQGVIGTYQNTDIVIIPEKLGGNTLATNVYYLPIKYVSSDTNKKTTYIFEVKAFKFGNGETDTTAEVDYSDNIHILDGIMLSCVLYNEREEK